MLSFLLIASFSFAQDTLTYVAFLNGRQEVLPVTTPAGGSVTLKLIGNQLQVEGSFSKLSSGVLEEQTHIHLGYAGQNGPVVFGLIASLSENRQSGRFETALNTFSLAPEQIEALAARSFYVNIHTENFPSGEIRGQVLPRTSNYFSANLFGSHEVPSVFSRGNGGISIELISPTQIVVTGSFQNLEGDFDANIGGGAHLHIGLAGQNGPVTIPIRATLATDLKSGIFEARNNTIEINANQLNNLSERQLYANIHTTTFPQGELRGQVVPAEASSVFRAFLSGNNVLPAVVSGGTGELLAEIYSDTLMILSGSINGLSSSILSAMALQNRFALSFGLAGQSGNTNLPLQLSNPTENGGSVQATDNVFLLSANQSSALYKRGIYANITTQNFPNGELRGQLTPDGQIFMNGILSGTLVVPPSKSFAYGGIQAELNGDKLTLSGAFEGLESNFIDGATVRLGNAGSNGVSLFDLAANVDANGRSGSFDADANTFTLSEESITALLNRAIYIAISTGTENIDELRGQLLAEANAYFVATLSGQSQSPGINTEALGQVMMEITGNRIIASGSFNNLSSSAGEIALNQGLAGEIGNTIVNLNANLNAGNQGGIIQAANNTFESSVGILGRFNDRNTYVNIPSATRAAGEIRGQFLPLANAYFTSTLSSINNVLPTRNGGGGSLKADLVGNLLTITGSFAGLEGTVTDSSAVLFIGAAGTNGQGAFTLTPTIAEGAAAGKFEAAGNQFTLTTEQADAIRDERIYLSINTATAAIRGQLLNEFNQAPRGDIEILEPTNGFFFRSEGDPTSPLQLRWQQPIDNNRIYYIYQTSTFNDFRTIDDEGILNITGNTLRSNLGALDTALMFKGLSLGDTIQRHYRLIASDGALQTVGRSNLITVVRGQVVRSEGIDLEISITAPAGFYRAFQEVPFQIKVVNKGPQTARDIFVSAPIPRGMAFTRATPSRGLYNTFFQWWNFRELAAGDTATLNLTLFPLIDDRPIVNFVEIIGALPRDIDSTPNNGTPPTPREDDEAVVTIFPEPVIRGGDTSDLALSIIALQDTFTQFSEVPYLLTLINRGPDTAANIKVSALIPEGMAFTSAEASNGRYGVVTQDWTLPFLGAGDTATLKLVLFTLIDNRPITLFTQVTASDQFDPNSTPANDTDNVPDEDDEAAVTIFPRNGVRGGQVADLELSLSIDRTEYQVFTNYVYTFTLVNKGPDDASNIFVDAQLPDSLVYTSKAASIGDWNNFFQFWFVPFLRSGETQTLKLNLFTLARQTPITFFTQIIRVDQTDPDSTPNNNADGIPREDDEASLTIRPANRANGIETRSLEQPALLSSTLFPVPASEKINLVIEMSSTQASTIRILDATAKLVMEQTALLVEGTNQLTFDIQALPAGIYQLVINEQAHSIRFVKVNND
jgi:uncharacterized repeat protein (TIGR01451 family)